MLLQSVEGPGRWKDQVGGRTRSVTGVVHLLRRSTFGRHLPVQEETDWEVKCRIRRVTILYVPL